MKVRFIPFLSLLLSLISVVACAQNPQNRFNFDFQGDWGIYYIDLITSREYWES